MATYDVIDVSEFNSITNYTSAANEVDGVIIRCGYRGYGSQGTKMPDDNFEDNYAGFSGKTKIGYYFFTQAITTAEAEDEAEYVVNTLIDGKTCDFPIYWDTEDSGTGGDGRADGLSRTQRTACCIAFINKIKALGYRAGVYASENWFQVNLDYDQIAATGASIWCAKYDSSSPEIDDYDGWQYTSSSSVSGISGNVDRSRFYKDVAGWDSDVPVSSVSLNKNTLNLLFGNSETLIATVLPSDATDKSVSWSTSNSSVATVNSSGSVTAVGNGSCTITVTTTDGGKTATCSVNVTTAVTGVTLNKNSTNIQIGATETLTATVLPVTASNKNVTWSSSNNNVATVNSNGVVTAVGIGNCTITVTTVDGGKTATCNTTVAGIPVQNVSLDKSTLNLDISDHYTLTATVLPENATNKNVTWSSSNNNVATVTSNGIVSPLSNGSCTITVTTVDGGKTATCSVTVTTKITGITLDKSSAKVEKTQTLQLNASLIPSTATPKPINWVSSDSTIATVNNGLITGLKSGSCTISASVTEGSNTYTATCEVSIIVYPTSVTLNIHNINKHILNETPVEILEVTLLPEDTTETNIIWRSTNPNIVEVNILTGELVYKENAGSCIISVTAKNNLSDSCNVKVYKRLQRPNSPILSYADKHSIHLQEESGMEYSITNGEMYQRDSVFDNLDSDTSYKLIQRRYAYNYYVESLPSAELTVSTKDIIHVESVSFAKHQIELIINNTYTEYDFKDEVIILPEDAELKDIFFSVSDQSIGTIDSIGKFTVRESGVITVSVTSVDRGLSDSCQVTVYKKWKKPDPPTVQYVSSTSIILDKPSNLMEYSIDGGTVWTDSNTFVGLKRKTAYEIICRLKSDRYNLQSDSSSSTSVKTLDTDIEPSDRDVHPEAVTLSAHALYFDLRKNLHAVLNYTVTPLNTTNKTVIWSSENDQVIKVNSNGELNAVGVGKSTINIKTLDGGKIDHCECTVIKTLDPPSQPETIDVGIYNITLKDMGEDIEYSIDGNNWTDTTEFNNLSSESFYTFYQRYKSKGEYQPASNPSQGLTVKTLPKEKPGGVSPSGYEWGQQVEVNNISIYTSPYSKKSDMKLSGTYYIFSILESNNRIRITDIEDYIDVPGHSLGWVNIKDLKLIISDINIGDKVIVNGDINIYADGSGIFIHKAKEDMYITDIIPNMEYQYGVTDKPGKNRQGFAKSNNVKKYIIIDV